MFSKNAALVIALFVVVFVWAIVTDQNALPVSGLPSKKQRQLQQFGQIESLVLMNADTSLPIISLTNGVNISTVKQNTRNFNIVAITSNGTIGSIQFSYNDEVYNNERNPPYTLCGNNGNGFNACSVLGVGQHTVTATPLSSNGKGVNGSSFEVTFTITDEKTTLPQVRFELLSMINLPFAKSSPHHQQ
jgi:hypothetical protein